jgi:hypothetical protein
MLRVSKNCQHSFHQYSEPSSNADSVMRENVCKKLFAEGGASDITIRKIPLLFKKLDWLAFAYVFVQASLFYSAYLRAQTFLGSVYRYSNAFLCRNGQS